MEVSRYKELKAKGKVAIRKEEGRIKMIISRYDEWSGEEIETVTQDVTNQTALLQRKEIIEKELDNINTILDDIAAELTEKEHGIR